MGTRSAIWSAVVLALLAIHPVFSATSAEPLTYKSPVIKVTPVVPFAAYPFELRQVRLLDGPFRHAMELDHQYLLSLDPDRLLHVFRTNAGLPSSAEPLGGWEDPKCELRGHFVGHYLSACSLMYASTGDQRLKQRVDYIVAELAKCQEKLGGGYLSAFPVEFIDRVETTGRVWAPYYTLHKILAGLLDAFVYCGNEQSLQIAEKFGDWVVARNARLSDQEMQRMLGVEHGGMNEALANLYALSGEAKYLAIAERFNHHAVLEPVSRGQDVLTGLHANTQIPKFIGAARLYELTGKDWYRNAAVNFWNFVVKERSYVIGGHSDSEHFSPKERLSQFLGPNTTETCNTYNMLKLTKHLLCWEPSIEKADYYERALFNHILASQEPETGMMCYYVPLRSGAHKTYSSPLDSFWCCTGTGIENHAKYGESIYFHNGTDALYVNLFIASEVDWDTMGFTVRQETRFPDEAKTRLVISAMAAKEATLCIRWPSWVTQGFQIAVNGDSVPLSGQPGQFVTVRRMWHDGDTVSVELPMSLRTEGFRDNPQRFAFLCGPIVLAAELPKEKTDSSVPLAATGEFEPNPEIPLIVADTLDLSQFETVPDTTCQWVAPKGLFRRLLDGEDVSLTLKPFFRIHGPQRYVVYWDQVMPQEWHELRARFQQHLAKWQELEQKTLDRVKIGSPESEKKHQLQGERTTSGTFQGRAWRHATEGGWFGYTLQGRPGTKLVLVVEYWGSDGGNRVFDIVVNGQKIATQRLANNRPGQFYYEIYEIPAEAVDTPEAIRVEFRAHPDATAGGIFDLRLLAQQ